MAQLLDPKLLHPAFVNTAYQHLINKNLTSIPNKSNQTPLTQQPRSVSNISTSSILTSTLNINSIQQHRSEHLMHPVYSLHGVVTEYIDDCPTNLAEVNYYAPVQIGNVMRPFETRYKPCVRFPGESDRFYTLLMFDPDTPSRCNNSDGEWHHWLVGNIPGE